MVNTRAGQACESGPKATLGILFALILGACATAPPGLNPRLSPMAEFCRGAQLLEHAHSATERAQARAWMRRAAEANLAVAQDWLGAMYLTGNGAPQDTPRALRWIRRAANCGAPAAQVQLAHLYEAGTLVAADRAEAYYWYSVAAKPVRSGVTITNIGQVRDYAHASGETLGSALTPAQRASVRRRVRAWHPTPCLPYTGTVDLGNAAH
jgi:Sel1 repeat